MFDDLPKELAEALLQKNLSELLMRPIQRPFSEEELAELIAEIKQMDPATAVCDWTYAEVCDPYGVRRCPAPPNWQRRVCEGLWRSLGMVWGPAGGDTKRTLRCA